MIWGIISAIPLLLLIYSLITIYIVKNFERNRRVFEKSLKYGLIAFIVLFLFYTVTGSMKSDMAGLGVAILIWGIVSVIGVITFFVLISEVMEKK
jgi:hypothetical protein